MKLGIQRLLRTDSSIVGCVARPQKATIHVPKYSRPAVGRIHDYFSAVIWASGMAMISNLKIVTQTSPPKGTGGPDVGPWIGPNGPQRDIPVQVDTRQGQKEGLF